MRSWSPNASSTAKALLSALIALMAHLSLAAQPDPDDEPGSQQPAVAQSDHDDDDDDDERKPVSEIVVTARRFDEARAKVEPSLGAATYSLSNEAVESRPSSETVNLSQVLLQAPGVTQLGSGEIRVRSQGNLQYRINNVILPEGLTDIGESLSARLAERVELITGALPAQYGLQVGGIVNVTTKSGVYDEGGQAELYGGSHGEFEPAFEYAGSAEGTNFFFTGGYLGSDVGLSSPDGSASPAHDRTDQIDGFAFLDRIVDDETRVSLALGTSNERFQIPVAGGLLDMPGLRTFQRPLAIAGVTGAPDPTQGGDRRGTTNYGIVSLLHTTDRLTLQASAFARYSTLSLHPDAVNDLLISGLGQEAANRDTAGGLQFEGVYDLSDTHTLRAGLSGNLDHEKSDTRSLVLALASFGQPAASVPENRQDTSSETRREVSLFVQDGWKPLDDLTVNAGLRFDHVSALGGRSEVSPRANLVWTPLEGTTLHAGYARYFVPAPTDEEVGATPILIGTTGAPPGTRADPVRPESDDYYDVGVEQKVDGLTVGLDGYWRNATNLIDEAPIGLSTLQRAFNYATGHVRGLELSATYFEGPFSGWANLAVASAEGRRIASNQFAFTAAELAFSGEHFVPLSQSQDYTASAGVSYKWGSARLSADLVYGSGSRRTLSGGAPNGATLPAYTQVNIAAVYRTQGIGLQPLDLRLDVLNLFDQRYELQDGSSIGGGVPQWGPRRGFFAGVEQSF